MFPRVIGKVFFLSSMGLDQGYSKFLQSGATDDGPAEYEQYY